MWTKYRYSDSRLKSKNWYICKFSKQNIPLKFERFANPDNHEEIYEVFWTIGNDCIDPDRETIFWLNIDDIKFE